MRTRAILTSMTVCASPAWAAAPVMDDCAYGGDGACCSRSSFMAVLVGKAVLTSNTFKGWLGESRVRQLAVTISRSRIHTVSCTMSPCRRQDGTTQIDHIIVSSFGMFVIETKHMSGWIFGRASDPKWTQSFRSHKNSLPEPSPAELQAYQRTECPPRSRTKTKSSRSRFSPATQSSRRRCRKFSCLGEGSSATSGPKTPLLLSESDLQRILLKINGSMLERSADTERQHALNHVQKTPLKRA
jgi:hypothetical protein